VVSEDLVLFATMKLGRPVKWEWTREEQFIGATTRHQMTTRVKIGARKDGTLTALDVEVFSNTGTYGGHGGETLAGAMGSPLATYRCANKKGIGHAVYTNMIASLGSFQIDSILSPGCTTLLRRISNGSMSSNRASSSIAHSTANVVCEAP
jgi:CO/xanthine dehydrogenase Mo-binding subunit